MNSNPNYNALMHEICVGKGWCGGIVDEKPSHVDDLIPDTGPVSADQFVDWLFVAEGLDPLSEADKWQKHKDGLKDAFVRHMGADVIDASALKWDLR
jgi:hypothetical protein